MVQLAFTWKRAARAYRWLTSPELRDIRDMIDSDVPVQDIAARTGRDPSHIHKIKLGRIHRAA